MPKRTNAFQELVALIERALAPAGAKVTESAEVSVNGLTTLREVDVLIEGQYGPYSMKIAVEARDHKRKIDLIAFDSFLAKFRGECRVNVDKFVLVASAGFTEGVVEKAKRIDVELLTLAQAKSKDWSKVGPGTLHFHVASHICKIWVEPRDKGLDEKAFLTEAHLICPHGHDHGLLKTYANCRVFHKWLPSQPDLIQSVERQVEASAGGVGHINATFSMPGYFVKYKGSEYPISSLKVDVHIASQKGAASHSAYVRESSTGNSQMIHHIEGCAAGKKISLVIPGEPGSSRTIAMRIGDMDNALEQRRKQARVKRARRKK